MKRFLVMSLSVLFVAGCGGGKSQPASATSAQPNPCAAASGNGGDTGATGNDGAGSADGADAKTAAINKLMSAIGDKMAKLSPREAKGETLDDTCASIEVTDPCKSKCTMGDDICKDAKQVCSLAGELSGNTAAADQCTAAKDSCRRAEIACCECKQAG